MRKGRVPGWVPWVLGASALAFGALGLLGVPALLVLAALLGLGQVVVSVLSGSRAAALGVAAALCWPLWGWARLSLRLASSWSRLASGAAFAPPAGAEGLFVALFLPALLGAGALVYLALSLGVPGGRGKGCAVVLCRTLWGAPVVVSEEDRYLHVMVVGPTGCGKTTRALLPMVCQDIDRIAAGEHLGVTVVEPKGDLVREVEAYARARGVPVAVLDPGDPGTLRFNPLQGDPLIVAEVTRTVLKSMFGRQEAFFSHVQETSAHNTVLLLKYLEAHDREVALAEGREPPCLTMQDLVRVLRNPEQLKAQVDALRRLDPQSDIVEYFDREALGPTGAKLHEFAMGLRMQLEDIAGSPQLRQVFGGRSDVDLDAHLRGGAVLCVNTCMGLLGRKGDLFGQFFIMHFQQAVFRRPPGERPPHFLYLDEFPRYLNPDFERMVAMARSYRCGLTLALQVTDQLLLAEAPAFREVMVQNCRNRLVFGGMSASDAERFAREFGEVEVRRREHTFRRQGALVGWWPEAYRESERFRARFDYTHLIHLPRWHVVYQVVRDGVVQVPRQGVSLSRPSLPARVVPPAAVPASGAAAVPARGAPALAPGSGAGGGAPAAPAPAGASAEPAAPAPVAAAAPEDDFF